MRDCETVFQSGDNIPTISFYHKYRKAQIVLYPHQSLVCSVDKFDSFKWEYSICLCFNLCLPNEHGAWNIFMCTFVFLMSLVKCQVKIPPIFVLSSLSFYCWVSKIIYDIKILLCIFFIICFSHYLPDCEFLSVFLDNAFEEQKS